ncbi:MAG: AAA family ATPase [Acidobacteria bacterium]|nr:AAA family ATPase [Acidobacteriota bacterium]
MDYIDNDGNEEIYDPPDRENEVFRDFINSLPLIPPQEIAGRLEPLGYKGQEEPRRALSLMAYRHIRRLKRLHLQGENRRQLPPKQNTMLVGPTGCGKTYLVELLFQQIFQLPTVIVDVTSFTESGYIGDDVNTILTRLLYAAEGNLLMASCGIVCLDEFDKLASSTSNSRFAGEGTTKDVSGYGVQRELLKIVEGTDIMIPMDYGYSAFGQRAPLSTRDIPFIACGTFSGIDEITRSQGKSIGFRDKKDQAEAGSPVLEEIEIFQRYGFLPELMGRFARIVRFQALPAETLKRILHDNVLPQFVREFKIEGLQLTVTENAINHIIHRSRKRGTGARGLHTGLINAIEQAAFETFQQMTNAEVIIDLNGGKLGMDIRKRA